jgi:hypothetical protein
MTRLSKDVVLGMDVFEQAGKEVLITTRSKAKHDESEENEAAESLKEATVTPLDIIKDDSDTTDENSQSSIEIISGTAEISDDPIWADFNAKELQKLQHEDPTLGGLRDRAVPTDQIQEHRVCFYWEVIFCIASGVL